MDAEKIRTRVMTCLAVAGGIFITYCVFLGLILVPTGNGRSRQSSKCFVNLRSIVNAGKRFAEANSNSMPRTFLEFSDYLSSPTNLICPAAPHARKEMKRLTSWKDFDERLSSYEILNPGVSTSNEYKLYLRCKAHDQFVAVDNTVHRRWDLTNDNCGFRYELPAGSTRTNQTR
jgi:hypothetical protein